MTSRADSGRRFESMILNPSQHSLDEGMRLIGAVYDLRSSGDLEPVTVELVEAMSGAVRSSRSFAIGAGQIRKLPLEQLLATVPPGDFLRFRLITGDDKAVSAFAVAKTGEVAEFALLPQVKAHESGTYPLPNLEENTVIATFVNVGDSPTEVLGHVDWEGGSYAIAPFMVSPGGSYRLDINSLALSGGPDLLGRTLDPHLQRGFFQWSSRLGSAALLARTEIFPLTSVDFYGFNCFGCCPEKVWGGTIPSVIAFDLGETPSFTASQWIETCTGTMGPYPAWSPTLAYTGPLSWNGQSISASDYTGQDVSFTASESVVQVTCTTREVRFGGTGRVDVDKCQKQHNPGYDPKKGCTGMFSSCGPCKSCCDRETAVAKCRCDKLFFNEICKKNAVVACQKCKEVCVSNDVESCTNGSTSCI